MNIVRITLLAAAGVMTAQAFINVSMAKRNLQNQKIIDLQMAVVSEMKKDIQTIECFVCDHNRHLIDEYYTNKIAFYNATRGEDDTMDFFASGHE